MKYNNIYARHLRVLDNIKWMCVLYGAVIPVKGGQWIGVIGEEHVHMNNNTSEAPTDHILPKAQYFDQLWR